MSLTRKRKRRGASITSLIDVIFLLLMFFMLASTFSKRAEIEFSSAAEAPTGNDAPDIIQVLVLADGLKINGRPVLETMLATSLGEQLSEPGSIITVKLSNGVTTQRLVDILLLLRPIPNARITIVEPL